jgi:multidrug efflux system outer membrane protein
MGHNVGCTNQQIGFAQSFNAIGNPRRERYADACARAVSPGQPVDLLMRRPDLIAAQARVNAAVKQTDAARLNYWPTISLSGVLTRNGWELAGQSLGPQYLARRNRQTELFAARNEEVAQRGIQLTQVQRRFEVCDTGRLDIDQVRVSLLASQSSQVREQVGKLQAQFALFRAMAARPPPQHDGKL